MNDSPAVPAPSRDEVARLFAQPLLSLVHEAATVHRAHHDPAEVQCSSLLSVKTGACPEDCSYCPQSAHHESVERESLMETDEVLDAARSAKARGADRFCLGAAWRDAREGPGLDRLIEMIEGVKGLGLETCATLGMLPERSAERLRDAGLDYYNHNLDTSEAYYDKIITTRTYADRLQTLATVRAAGMRVCCGGILGMGETQDDRIDLLHTLATLDPAPESVPINALVPVEGTPLEEQPPLPWDELVRAVAVARILMPTSMVRLSAGRTSLSEEAQALCFLAGANSIFLGDKLLTTPNPGPDRDTALFAKLGLRPSAEPEESRHAVSDA
jgi:biotin synthase